jgi:predicted dehydrogenase
VTIPSRRSSESTTGRRGRRRACSRAHGVAAKEFGSDDELFDNERVNIIVSCTTPDARAEHVVRAAESGRHVVIEKPVALTIEGVEEIRDAVERAGVKTVTSFVSDRRC